MRQLTERQRQVLETVRTHIEEIGFPPSVREIGERLGLRSSCTVQRHLEALMSKGYLTRDGSKARTLEVIGGGRRTREARMRDVPLLGRVAAGEPLLAEEHVEDHVPIAREFLGDGEAFALRVKGDSMIGVGLFDGDILVVRRQEHAKNGDIVVALVEGSEATVKTFYRDGTKVRLQPENPSMQPIFPDDCAILGKALMSIRRFA
jgi:repressor LexA